MARRNGNPEIAFQDGVKKGIEKGYAMGYKDGGLETINHARNFAALAMHNVASDYTRSEKKAWELIKAFWRNRKGCTGKNFLGSQTK